MEGVPQGGPTGPTMFVTANEGFAEELASALKERNITADMISSLSDPLGRFDIEVDMSRIFYC